MELVTLYVTTGGKESAERIGRALLEKRLAACVNIFDNVTSLYWWDGAIQKDPEVVFMAKTREDLVTDCMELIRDEHSDDVPCITVAPVIRALPSYASWVQKETR